MCWGDCLAVLAALARVGASYGAECGASLFSEYKSQLSPTLRSQDDNRTAQGPGTLGESHGAKVISKHF